MPRYQILGAKRRLSLIKSINVPLLYTNILNVILFNLTPYDVHIVSCLLVNCLADIEISSRIKNFKPKFSKMNKNKIPDTVELTYQKVLEWMSRKR